MHYLEMQPANKIKMDNNINILNRGQHVHIYLSIFSVFLLAYFASIMVILSNLK